MRRSQRSDSGLGRASALAVAALLLLLSTGAAVAAPVDRGLGTLEIGSRGPAEISGQFGRAGSLLFFSSRRVAASLIVVQVQVNGVVLDASMSLEPWEVNWTGHGSALFRHDRDTLLAFTRRLDERLAPQTRALPPHEDILRRLAHFWAEAPVGQTLGEQRVTKPAAGRPDPRFPGESPFAAVEGCYIPENNGVTLFSCTFQNKVVCHDADNGGHCFTCEAVPAGCGGSCLAECGPGCFGTNTVSWDCGDHDRCCQHHGGCTNPFDSNCGDEYFEAADDFISGIFNCPFCGGI